MANIKKYSTKYAAIVLYSFVGNILADAADVNLYFGSIVMVLTGWVSLLLIGDMVQVKFLKAVKIVDRMELVIQNLIDVHNGEDGTLPNAYGMAEDVLKDYRESPV